MDNGIKTMRWNYQSFKDYNDTEPFFSAVFTDHTNMKVFSADFDRRQKDKYPKYTVICEPDEYSGILQDELRIGNMVDAVVSVNRTDRVIVRSIGYEGVDIWTDEEFKVYAEYEFHQLRPIPLTADRLESLGAYCTSGTYPLECSYDLFGMQLTYSPQHGWKDFVHRTQIRGIHHLQNLMYFTRGMEINVNALME
jgi:hypothetical protein